MPTLAHPLDDAVRKVAVPSPLLSLLADCVVAARQWKIAYAAHEPNVLAAEYALTQAAVALAALVDLHHAAARRAAHRDSVGSIYQVPVGPSPVTSTLGPPALLSADRAAQAADLLEAFRAAVAKVSSNGTASSSSNEPAILGTSARMAASVVDMAAHLADLLVALADGVQLDFFAPVPPAVDPAPAGSRQHPTVWPLLDTIGPAAMTANDWPSLLAALKAATARIKVANPALLNYLTFFAANPLPPSRAIPVDFQGLPDFLQLPHQHAAVIDFWWNHNRFPPLQPFPAVAAALAEYLRPDPLARELWNKFRQCALDGSSGAANGGTGGGLVWLADDLGSPRMDPGQQLTPADLAQILPADASYDTSIGDWLVWRLLGWLYLALETENQLYAMRKQLPLTEHARPVALIQAAMNQLRARYGYTRDVHARLAMLALKLLHRPYPLFAPRFHQVTHFLNSLHAQVADLLARPYLDADASAWRRVYDSVTKAVRGWGAAHAIAVPPEAARAATEGSAHLPTDLGPMLARVADHARGLAGRFFINPVSLTKDPATAPDALRWMGIPVSTTPIAPATSLVLAPALLDATARAMALAAHAWVHVIYGVTIVHGHWAVVTEAAAPVADDHDRSQLDVLAEWTDADRLALVRGLASALWVLASAGIHVRCWPNGRPLKLVRVGGVVKLPLADIVAHLASLDEAAASACDIPGIGLFLGTLVKNGGGPALTALADDLERASRDCNPARPDHFFLAATQAMANAANAAGAPGTLKKRHSSVSSSAAPQKQHQHLAQNHVRHGSAATIGGAASPSWSGVNAAAPAAIADGRAQSPGYGLYRANTMSPAGISGNGNASSPHLHHQQQSYYPGRPDSANPLDRAAAADTAAALARRNTTGSAGSGGNGPSTPQKLAVHSRQGTAGSEQLTALMQALPLDMGGHRAQPSSSSGLAGRVATPPLPPPQLPPPAMTAPTSTSSSLDPALVAETWSRALSFYRHGQGDLSAAFALFAEVADAIPAALFYMGEILYYGSKTSGLRQDTAQAAAYYARARDRGCRIAAVGLGDCAVFGFGSKRNLAHARAYYEAALELPASSDADLATDRPAAHPLVTARTRARAWAGLGDCCLEAGDADQARVCYQRAVALDPGPGGLPLPDIAGDTGEFETASAAETEALGGLGPGCRKAHARLAELYTHGQGGLPQSLDAAREFLKRARGCRREVLAKCAYLRACGEPRQADEYQDEYLWRYPLDF
ncbi:Receptor-interacting serine/threonine-protein kinase 3 [Blastocladiella emersonii ATCC 22665]|nr:Receptor-interacting serine/threonine-protein kinase 3 [Blastocladiella emersonii ATCC 22665]